MVQKNSLKPLIVICGPTASGKTSLAINVAKQVGGEIVSADSMNIYKGLNIGTAKPTVEEQSLVKHYLIDIISPSEEFSVSDYKQFAQNAIENIYNKGKIPILVGGTGFYINSVLYDYSYGNAPKNDIIRNKYQTILNEKGEDYLFELLKSVDEESAKVLHKNDTMRVIRALEIFEVTGIKKSQFNEDPKPNYNFLAFSMQYSRHDLYNRIDERVEHMINQGLIEEVKTLIENGITISNQCMQGIGYKETYNFIINNGNITDLISEIKLNTHHYAKRQETFFKRLNNLTYLNPNDNCTEIIINCCKKAGLL